jgi:hypothetical protein
MSGLLVSLSFIHSQLEIQLIGSNDLSISRNVKTDLLTFDMRRYDAISLKRGVSLLWTYNRMLINYKV